MASRTMSQHAQFLATRGFAVFPIYTMDPDGLCSCRNPSCHSPGKHPIGSLVPQGVNNAELDTGIIKEWWATYPDANIGIATGDVSGIVVLDIDAKSGGDVMLENLEQRLGVLPPTWMVMTGGGGFHFYFKMPNADIRNSAGAIASGIDVRGNGGYVVAPPSLHASGNKYRWSSDLHPKTTPMADVTGWLLDRMAPRGFKSESKVLPRKIKSGERNVWITSIAGTMRRRGFCGDAIYAAISIENRRRCEPPMDDREVRRIANSVERYAPEAVLRINGSVA